MANRFGVMAPTQNSNILGAIFDHVEKFGVNYERVNITGSTDTKFHSVSWL